MRFGNQLVDAVDGVLVGSVTVHNGKSVDHSAQFFESRLYSLPAALAPPAAASEAASERVKHHLLELVVSRTKSTHPMRGKQRLNMSGLARAPGPAADS